MIIYKDGEPLTKLYIVSETMQSDYEEIIPVAGDRQLLCFEDKTEAVEFIERHLENMNATRKAACYLLVEVDITPNAITLFDMPKPVIDRRTIYKADNSDLRGELVVTDHT